MSGIKRFIVEDGVLTEYRGRGGDVIVPKGVTPLKRAGKELFRELEDR